MRTCIVLGNREAVFEPCDALSHFSPMGITAVLGFETFVAFVLALACMWRRRLMHEKGNGFSSGTRSSSPG